MKFFSDLRVYFGKDFLKGLVKRMDIGNIEDLICLLLELKIGRRTPGAESLKSPTLICLIRKSSLQHVLDKTNSTVRGFAFLVGGNS